MGREKYHELRNNREIMRWYKDICRGSLTTGTVYLRRLGSFCVHTGKTPEALLKMNDMNLANLITDYVSDLESSRHSGSYVTSAVKGVKSWLSFNGIKLPRRIKIKGAGDTPTLDNKQLFNQEELKKVLNAGDLRSRVAISLVAFSGVRLQSLGNETGEDGIKLSDLPELKIQREELFFDSVPTKVVVRKQISKKRHEYFTFLGPEGCDYLRLYLNDRMRSGEDLRPDSALLTKSKLALRVEPFLTRSKVSDLIRAAIRTAGFENRPYDLRSYFDSRMLMAQDSRLVLRDYRTFWMGHKGDIEHKYTTDRKLAADQVESMRNSYARAMKFLETDFKMTEEEESRKFRLGVLHLDGFSDDEIERMGLLDMDERELLQKRKERLFGASLNKNRQKVISLSDVQSFIENGWEYIGTLPGDKAIIRPPP